MTFLYLNSCGIGNGPSSELSEKLMEVFLGELVSSKQKVDIIGCVNSGVFLTTREGPSLESLRKLEQNGAQVVSCGTCLKHFNLEKDIKIGMIGTMDKTVNILFDADKVIRPC